MTLTVHHLEHSQSFRIVWFLEELGMPYELKTYKRTDQGLAPPEYKAISPLGTSPTITDGNFALSESNAIMEYILDKAQQQGMDTKNLRPAAGTPERNDYLFWFHASASSFQLVMSTDSLFRMIPKRVPWPMSLFMKSVAAKVHANFLDPRLEAIFKLAQTQLSSSDYLAGSGLTAADVSAIYSFDAALTRMPELARQYPACQAWLERMRERPAFKSALRRIGEDTISMPV